MMNYGWDEREVQVSLFGAAFASDTEEKPATRYRVRLAFEPVVPPRMGQRAWPILFRQTEVGWHDAGAKSRCAKGIWRCLEAAKDAVDETVAASP